MSSALWICICLISTGSIHVGNAIKYGILADEGTFQYMVAIFTKNVFTCGGAIIDASHILTAGHCVFCAEANQMIVVAGSTNVGSESRVLRGVATIYVHQHYKGMETEKFNFMQGLCLRATSIMNLSMKNDIAVLTLAEPLPLGGNIFPAKLPETDFLPYCQMMLFAGWGWTKDDRSEPFLQFMDFTIVHPDMKVFADNFTVDDESQFVAKNLIGGMRPGYGDSGGPLIHNNVIYGVLSSAWPTGITLFTQVFHYLDFIKNASEDSL